MTSVSSDTKGPGSADRGSVATTAAADAADSTSTTTATFQLLLKAQQQRIRAFHAWGDLFNKMLLGEVSIEELDNLASATIAPVLQRISDAFRSQKEAAFEPAVQKQVMARVESSSSSSSSSSSTTTTDNNNKYNTKTASTTTLQQQREEQQEQQDEAEARLVRGCYYYTASSSTENNTNGTSKNDNRIRLLSVGRWSTAIQVLEALRYTTILSYQRAVVEHLKYSTTADTPPQRCCCGGDHGNYGSSSNQQQNGDHDHHHDHDHDHTHTTPKGGEHLHLCSCCPFFLGNGNASGNDDDDVDDATKSEDEKPGFAIRRLLLSRGINTSGSASSSSSSGQVIPAVFALGKSVKQLLKWSRDATARDQSDDDDDDDDDEADEDEQDSSAAKQKNQQKQQPRQQQQQQQEKQQHPCIAFRATLTRLSHEFASLESFLHTMIDEAAGFVYDG